MLYTILPSDMKRIENRVMEKTGVSALTLMERAAEAVADIAAPYLRDGGKLLALCGTGNNGGDAIAAARILLGRYSKLEAVVWQLPGETSAETAAQWEKLALFGRRVSRLTLGEAAPALPVGIACIVDGLFGTGLNRPLQGIALEIAERVNAGHVPVVAVDIPSGLNGATGNPPDGGTLSGVIRATETVTFHRPKPGLFLGDGPDYCGRVTVAEIGIGPEWDDAQGFAVLTKGDLLLPPRKRNTHKGDYGRVLLLVGSFDMAGAAALSAMAALRTGAGLVTVACPTTVVPTVQALCPCATCLPLPETDVETAWALLQPALERTDALAAGCGLGREALAAGLIKQLVPWLEKHILPAVLDADALNLIAEQKRTPHFEGRVVMTPHPGEAARLLHKTVSGILSDTVESAHKIATKYDAKVVLKGAESILIAKDGEAINLFGTPAMAKGGSGDVLTGILAALLAGHDTYGTAGVRLLQTGCALHGLAGILAAEKCGERGMLATDLCDALGRVPDVVDRCAAETLVKNGASRVPNVEFPAAYEASEETTGLKPVEMADGSIHPCIRETERGLRAALGRRVRVTVDRPLGTRHPEHRDTVYGLNYGYVADVLAADNEWQDAYVYGVAKPVEFFEGEVVAVIHRLNDVEDKWVVAKPGEKPTAEEIRAATAFAEKYFQSEIIL